MPKPSGADPVCSIRSNHTAAFSGFALSRGNPNLTSLIEQPLRELHQAVNIRKVTYQT